jgi:pimeloyl-ACP methyl ester carboxylesterase
MAKKAAKKAPKAKAKAKKPVVKAAPQKAGPKMWPDGFRKRRYKVNGVDTVVLEGGDAAKPALVFLHGAGTATGWAFAEAWANDFAVFVPQHPGFGESGDSARIESVHDYVLHYLDLFDALGLDKLNLVGLSMGGWIAAEFASRNSHRLHKLVLVAPAGLEVPDYPNTDIFRLRPEEFPAYLAHNVPFFLQFLPDPNDQKAFTNFLVANYRETTSWARIAWERAYDPDLPKWLHRIAVPTLLLYGDRDRIVPHQQASAWAKLIPKTKTVKIKEAGHLVLDEKPQSLKVIRDFLVRA